MKKLLFVSSEGGHLNEMLQLDELFDEYEYLVVTERTDATEFVKDKYQNYSYLKYGTQDHLLPYLCIFPLNIIKSFFIFLKFKPDAVITTGTHTAVPMCYIAHFFKKKVIYIETLASIEEISKAGKMVYNIADVFVVQWPELLAKYPKAVCWGWIY